MFVFYKTPDFYSICVSHTFTVAYDVFAKSNRATLFVTYNHSCIMNHNVDVVWKAFLFCCRKKFRDALGLADKYLYYTMINDKKITLTCR